MLKTAQTVKGVYGKKGLKRLGKRAAVKAAKESTVTLLTYDEEEHRVKANNTQLAIDAPPADKPNKLLLIEVCRVWLLMVFFHTPLRAVKWKTSTTTMMTCINLSMQTTTKLHLWRTVMLSMRRTRTTTNFMKPTKRL